MYLRLLGQGQDLANLCFYVVLPSSLLCLLRTFEDVCIFLHEERLQEMWIKVSLGSIFVRLFCSVLFFEDFDSDTFVVITRKVK